MMKLGTAGVVLSMGVVGCGASEEPEALGVAQSELVSGARSVTSAISNQPRDPASSESETTININEQLGQSTIRTVAYNSDDPLFIAYTDTTRTVFRNASMLGWSWAAGTGTTYTHGRVRAPTGWAVLWGDPAIGQVPATSTVFISTLAVPDSKFPASGSISGAINNFLGGACIARSSDGGKNFTLGSGDCISDAGHFYDGGTLTGTHGPNGPIFAAYTDTVTNQIDVWRAASSANFFVQDSQPFPGKVIHSHPRLKYFNGKVYVAAVDSSKVLWASTRSVGNGDPWSTPFQVASAVTISAAESEIPLQSGVTIRSASPFAWDVGKNEAGADEFRVMTRRISPSGQHHMTGTRCTFINPGFLCSGEPVWSTENRGTASFMGAVAYSAVLVPNTGGTTRAVWKTSYLTETSPGKLAIEHANMWISPAKRFDVVPRVTGEQTPCPDNRGYWGDYDEMKVIGANRSSTTFFYRTFSDSTGEPCVRRQFSQRPLHISEVQLSQDANVAYKRTATASTVFPDNLHPASHAFDANLSSYWASINTATPQWIRIDLGVNRAVNKIKLTWGVRYARGYTLQTSVDGTTWTDRFTTTNSDGNVDELPSLGAIGIRYLRLNMSNPFGSGYSLTEFEVHGY